MAASAFASTIFYSTTNVPNAEARHAGETKAARSPFLISMQKPPSSRILRSPVEPSFCVESMMPFHTSTVSAMMTSMLSLSRRGFGSLPQAVPREQAASIENDLILLGSCREYLVGDSDRVPDICRNAVKKLHRDGRPLCECLNLMQADDSKIDSLLSACGVDDIICLKEDLSRDNEEY